MSIRELQGSAAQPVPQHDQPISNVPAFIMPVKVVLRGTAHVINPDNPAHPRHPDHAQYLKDLEEKSDARE